MTLFFVYPISRVFSISLENALKELELRRIGLACAGIVLAVKSS